MLPKEHWLQNTHYGIRTTQYDLREPPLLNRSEVQESFQRVSAEAAWQMIATGQYDVVDVREPGEWQQGHIPQSRLVPLQTLLRAPRQHLHRDRILFVCAVGQRSAVACEMAAAIGYTEIYNLEGGIKAWCDKGFPVVTEA